MCKVYLIMDRLNHNNIFKGWKCVLVCVTELLCALHVSHIANSIPIK